MRIAVVGCGAVGSFYGARLCRAGHEVHFLLRSDYDVVSAQGVQIRSVDGDFKVQPHCARFPREIGEVELVLIGLKTTANVAYRELLTPLVGSHTMVVTLQNGMGNEEQLAAIFGSEPVLGGLCFVCLNRLAPGIIQHAAHGRVVLGEHLRPPQPRAYALAELFSQAKIPCQVTPNLAQSHWEKLVWNVPFNGLGVAGCSGYPSVLNGRVSTHVSLGPCLTTDQLLGDELWEGLVRELMTEVIQSARGLGYPLADDLARENLERTRCMGAYRASTLVDFERGFPLELDSLFLKPRQFAAQANVPVPRLANLCDVLVELDLLRQYHLLPRQLGEMK